VRRWIQNLVFFAIVAALAWTLTRPTGGPPAGQAAPPLKLALLGADAPLDLTTLNGRTVVLDFWATWCPPCRVTLPVLQKVHTRYTGVQDVEVLSVNTEGPRAAELISRFMRQNAYDFRVLLDDGSATRAWRVESIPMLVVVAPDGTVDDVEVGVHSSDPARMEAALIEKIEAARAQTR
jgi:hypothetical protein